MVQPVLNPVPSEGDAFTAVPWSRLQPANNGRPIMKITNRAQLYSDAIKFAAGTATHGPGFATLRDVVTVAGLHLLLDPSKAAGQFFQDGKAERRAAFKAQRDCKGAGAGLDRHRARRADTGPGPHLG